MIYAALAAIIVAAALGAFGGYARGWLDGVAWERRKERAAREREANLTPAAGATIYHLRDRRPS